MPSLMLYTWVKPASRSTRWALLPRLPVRLMRAIGAANPKVTVYVRADEKIDYGQVVEVIQVLKNAKIEAMGLVTGAE